MVENTITSDQGIVLIGGSAGSLEVLLHILPLLRSDLLVPVVIIIHRGNDSISPLHELLAAKTKIKVREVEDKDAIKNSHIYIAPGDYHLLFEKDRSFSLDDSEKINFSRPSIDVSFESASEIYGTRTVGILLSGANADGTQGLVAIKEVGGTAIVQAPGSASVRFMPEHAIVNATIDHVIEPAAIAKYINLIR
jgi:two-component system chemotaxis response regulator CheB